MCIQFVLSLDIETSSTTIISSLKMAKLNGYVDDCGLTHFQYVRTYWQEEKIHRGYVKCKLVFLASTRFMFTFEHQNP